MARGFQAAKFTNFRNLGLDMLRDMVMQTTVSDLLSQPHGPLSRLVGRDLVALWSGLSVPGFELDAAQMKQLKRTMFLLRSQGVHAPLCLLFVEGYCALI